MKNQDVKPNIDKLTPKLVLSDMKLSLPAAIHSLAL